MFSGKRGFLMSDVLTAICILSLLAGMFMTAVRVHMKVSTSEQRMLEEIEESRRRAMEKQKGCAECMQDGDH